jgi:hypothetical protein
MSGTKANPAMDVAATAASMSAPLMEGTTHLLDLQANYFRQMEDTAVELLEHRREACAAARQLVERISTSRDPAEILRAQQEWFSGVLSRAAADAATMQSAASRMFGDTMQAAPGLPRVGKGRA